VKTTGTQKFKGVQDIVAGKENEILTFPVDRLARIETLALNSKMGLKTPYLVDF
jgi:hypothetical protein